MPLCERSPVPQESPTDSRSYCMYRPSRFRNISLHLTNAYFVPDARNRESPPRCRRAWCRREACSSGNTDTSLTLSAGRYYYSFLLKSGVKLYERRDVLLHAKTAVIDNVWSTVGSTNMDFWSFSSNDEVNAVILNKEFASEMEKMFARDLAASYEIRWKSGKKDLAQQNQEWFAHQFETLVVRGRIRSQRVSGPSIPMLLFQYDFK